MGWQANVCSVTKFDADPSESMCVVTQGNVALPPAAEQAVQDAAVSRNTDLQQRALELQALLR